MKIIHFCAGLEGSNGMANTARQFVAEELAAGHDSMLTNDPKVDLRGADVLHIHGTWLPVLWKVSKRAKKLGLKVIIRPAGNYDPIRRNFGFLKRLKKLAAAPFEHAMLRRADVVQATCETEAEWIRAYHPSAHIELTDLTRFFDLSSSSSSSLRSRPLHVMFLGRVHDPLKGVRYLEQAVKEINNSALQLSTSTSTPIDLHLVSNKYGEELEKEWDWCDVLCLPTLSENFGRVVAEALAHGKQVITTDGAPAWRDYFAAHPDCGYYLEHYREGDDKTRVQLLVDAIKYYLAV